MTELAPLSDGLVKLEQIVRPIAWQKNSTTSLWSGELAFRSYYTIDEDGAGWRVYHNQLMSEAGDEEVAFHPSLDTAKAAAEADYRARIASALNLDPILSEIKRMREALAFYRDEFHPKVHKPMPGASGITFHPSEALLDDCGQRAMDALSTLSPQEPDNG